MVVPATAGGEFHVWANSRQHATHLLARKLGVQFADDGPMTKERVAAILAALPEAERIELLKEQLKTTKMVK
ncbi:MAG: hypothetical protein L0Z49_09240, partial [Actinobacteria bacterium]|nr:hypothetical protein [Actinomycetota bacterium]